VEKRFEELPESGQGWAEFAPPYDEMIVAASKDLMKRSIGWMTRIHPLILESGRILLPLYSDGFNFSLVAISDDDGSTWRPSLPIVGRGPIQPALAERENGDIVALMRDSGDEPARVHYSVSHDKGESWSATVKTDIPNTASVELLKLQDGTWAFFGNPIDDGRYRLEFWLSNDEGHTWSSKKVVEEVEKGKGGFSYPSMIQTGDGLVHITYSYDLGRNNKSIKHVVVDPGKVR
jgi:predicted neuraminidase